jgi:hypothetical protein
MNKLKGGLSDNMKPEDLAKKHQITIKDILSQLKKGIKVEKEHTGDESKAKEIAMDHIYEDPKYYDKLSKIEMDEKWSQKYKNSIDCSNPKGFSQKAHCQGKKKKQESTESMGADSAGSFVGALSSKPIKRKIDIIHNLREAMTSDAAGPYDAPFGDGGKNPLKIGGPDSIKKSRAVKDKNFPKYGGPGGIFIKIKEKCKKFPYCNQGDINAIEALEMDGLKEAIQKASKTYGIPYSEMEKVVLNEINKIFIK